LLGGLAVSVATAIIMLATEPRLVIAWDEGYTLGREARIRAWLRALAAPEQFAKEWQPPGRLEEMVPGSRTPPPAPAELASRWRLLFDPRVVEWFWPFAREEPHGHPPFYALIGLMGDVLAPSWPDLARARLGPILLFSFTAGAIYSFVALRFGFWAAAVAAGAWALQPNLFGHGHYAAYDGVLTSLWVLALIAFARAVDFAPHPGARAKRWGWTFAFGVTLGCAAATKLTGWFLPLPFLAWAAVYRSRAALTTLGVGLLVAGCTLYAQLPPWWTQPIAGMVRFIDSNRTRSETQPIQILFLGTVYDTPKDSLPWYNTLVWTVMVTPVGFLMIAGAGIWSALRFWKHDQIALLCAGHWASLMILRALPHIPGHDGVRLFLPAFGMLALLAGAGARFLRERLPRWSRLLVVAALLEGAISVAVMMPVPLSYYSPIVGGLPGAAALGMEPTYYWDALSPAARRWLSAHTHTGQTILFRTFPLSWLYLRKTGELPPRLAPVDVGQTQWIVLQNRPGNFLDLDRKLVNGSRPAYTVRKLGVPLLWVFPYEAVRKL
jgi:4-amino-4-deoxy-L-arabinose transferase-like glycosyltransferase